MNKKLLQELREYSELLDKKDSAEYVLSMEKITEKQFMAQNYPQPQPKKVEAVKEKLKPKNIILALCALVAIILEIILFSVGAQNDFVAVIAAFLIMPNIFLVGFAFCKLPDFLVVLKAEKKKRQTEKWNKIEYPKLLQEYEKDYPNRKQAYDEYVCEFDDKHNKAKEQIKELNAELKKYEKFASIDRIDEYNVEYLVEVIADGRADTVEDAMDVADMDREEYQIEQMCRSCIYYKGCQKEASLDCTTYRPKRY